MMMFLISASEAEQSAVSGGPEMDYYKPGKKLNLYLDCDGFYLYYQKRYSKIPVGDYTDGRVSEVVKNEIYQGETYNYLEVSAEVGSVC